MSYNWEEIFKDKSDKELYEIYLGESKLPDSTIPFAKKELAIRNFDFENIEAYRDGWKLSRLIQEEDVYESEVIMRKLTRVSWKVGLLVVIGIILFFLLVFPDELQIGLFFVMLSAFLILANNFLSNIQQKNITKVRKEKQELFDKLEKENLLEANSPILNDIEREKEKNQSVIKKMLFVLALLTTLLAIMRFLEKHS